MKILIDIPEELYDEIIHDEACGLNELTRAIANGTPLPKGHGTISIDKVKEFKEEVESKYDNSVNSWDEKGEGRNEMICEVLEMLDELIESEDKE